MAIFLILSVVGIYASLVFVVSKPITGQKHISREQEMISQAADQQCHGLIRYGRQRLSLLQQCKLEEISYELPQGGNINPKSPFDKSCHMFHKNGAALQPCGPYKIVQQTSQIGSIVFGDTETMNVLPSGHKLRCAQFGGQLLTKGSCLRFEISDAQGKNFQTADICYAKNLIEKLSRGLEGPPLQFGRGICAQNCTSKSLFNGMSFGTVGGNIKYYYKPDGQLEPYQGSCLGHVKLAGTMLTPALYCDCWRSQN